MERRKFIKNSVLFGGGLYFMNPLLANAIPNSISFPVVRTSLEKRNFKSSVIENAIKTFQKNVANEELGWLFNNCFPNTLDTTVTFEEIQGKPMTYVITGDIDAMWLRDSSAQVFPYLQFCKKDESLRKLIAGVLNKQTAFILKDPYANAFYNDPSKEGYWKKDITKMQPGIHERKWEIDSLCYPIRLAYHYWKTTGDIKPFDTDWKKSIELIYSTFLEQQLKETENPYSFQRETITATDTRAIKGKGYPTKSIGLINSAFRPSDDATVFSFLIPSNFFAVISLKQASEMVKTILGDIELSEKLKELADEVETAIEKNAIVLHPQFGAIYAFEIDGFGGQLLMDDANVPSLLALPYLDAVKLDNVIYQNTRKFVWSQANPFYFEGKAASGIGGPHVGMDMIWPMSIIMKALTTTDKSEIKECITVLKNTHGGTGFMHEAFHKDDPTNFSRKWFAWANTLFGELLWKTYLENPELLV